MRQSCTFAHRPLDRVATTCLDMCSKGTPMVTKSTASNASDTSSDNEITTKATNRESGPAPKGTARTLDPEARPRSFREAFLLMAPERAALTKSELITPGPLDV